MRFKVAPIAAPAPKPVQQQLTAHILCESPRVVVIEKFLSDAECEHLMGLAQGKVQRSMGFDVTTGESTVVEIRTSSHTFLQREQDAVVADIENRIAQITQVPITNGEGLQILRYEIGQEYKAHHDYFDPRFPGSAKALDRGGQRIATILLYLTDVEAGGETDFPRLNMRVKPQKGQALLFCSVNPDGTLAGDSEHASLPVIAGEKWVATKWLRQFRFD